MVSNDHTQLKDGSDGVIDSFFTFFLLSTTVFEISVLCDKKETADAMLQNLN